MLRFVYIFLIFFASKYAEASKGVIKRESDTRSGNNVATSHQLSEDVDQLKTMLLEIKQQMDQQEKIAHFQEVLIQELREEIKKQKKTYNMQLDDLMKAWQVEIKEQQTLLMQHDAIIGSLQNDTPKSSAFLAVAYNSHTYSDGEVICFEDMLTNIGGDFVDSDTYICPKTGIYMFSVSFINYVGYAIVDVKLDNTILASLWCDGKEAEYNHCSTTVVTKCPAGAAVRNMCSYATCYVLGFAANNVFAGVLLSEIN